MTRSLKIAVADDERDMRDYFQQILPLLGHQVVAVAQTGRELVALCATTHPDLVITDIKMPDMDGIDAATQLYRNAPVPVILVSAYHDPEFIRRAEADHILAYLVKPIKQADLEPAIGIAMRRFEQFRGTPQGNLRPEAGTRGPQSDRESQGDPDEEGWTRRARRIPTIAETRQRQEPQADRDRPDHPHGRGSPRTPRPRLMHAWIR